MTNRPRDLFVLLQLVGHPLGRSFLSFAKRYCAAEDSIRLEDRRRIKPRGTHRAVARDDAAARQGGGDLTSAEVANVVADHRRERDRHSRGAGSDGTAGHACPGRVGSQRSAIAHASAGTLDRGEAEARRAKCPNDVGPGPRRDRAGEKVIVFSCFDEPLQRLAKAFGPAAVVVTGKVASGKRQPLVDRFQQDDDVPRVPREHRGTGLNLTAATQVIFNDLDWYPANHWQAEDRAYRLGQTRTVNVTYVVGVHTLDEFVQAVLETKRRS